MSDTNKKEVALFDLYGEKIYVKDKSSRESIYSITIKKEDTTNYASSYRLYINNIAIGDVINIPKDMVVQSGTLEECTTLNQPINGLKIGDKYIDLLIANSNNQHIYISLENIIDLSDYYNKAEIDKKISFTGKETNYGTIEIQNNEISILSAVGKKQINVLDDNTNIGEVFNDYNTNVASGNFSHSHGFNNSSRGLASDSTGLSNISRGRASHSNGCVCEAIADYSSCLGFGLVTKGMYQTAVGCLNEYDEENKYAFIVGIGTRKSTIEELDSTTRRNGFTVDWNSNIEFLGDAFYYENGNKISLKETLSNGGKLFSNNIPEDNVLINNTKYQIGVLSNNITINLPEIGTEIEVDFAVTDTIHNINCDYLQLNVVENTYYQIIFNYDKSLNTWFSSVVSSDYNTTSATDTEGVTTND